MKKITRARLLAAAVTVMAGGALLAGPATSALAAPPPAVCRVVAGHTLKADGSVVCGGSQYYVVMQGDGNLVEYGNGRALWSTRTQGNPGAYLAMQTDTNAVVYSKAGKALWSSRTSTGHASGGFFSVGADGNVAVSGGTGGIVWQNGAPGSDTETTDNLPGNSMALSVGDYLHAGNARLTLQSDGNLVATVAGKPVWSSKTPGYKGMLGVLQSDGNFVLINGVTYKPVWSTKTAGTGPNNRLTISPTGAVTLTKGAAVLWKAP